MRPLVLVALCGCLDTLGPPAVGARQFTTCGDADSDPDVAIAFERDIHDAIIARRCAGCHTPGGATPIGITIGGLDLSTYATLMRGAATPVVVPGRPCESLVVQKIGPAPPFGARMPKDGPPYLSADEAQTIVDWIAEGALEN